MIEMIVPPLAPHWQSGRQNVGQMQDQKGKKRMLHVANYLHRRYKPRDINMCYITREREYMMKDMNRCWMTIAKEEETGKMTDGYVDI